MSGSTRVRHAEATSPEEWRRVFAAADQVAELDPAGRMSYLERCSVEDPPLAAELEALLASGEAPSLLDSSAAQFAAAIFERASGHDEPPSQSSFGHYRILSEIGRGGMGAVYLAERSDDLYRKRVALKILPSWSAGDERRIQRFIEERQILAALDHPDIAQLLDGGITPDGLPWFAMELVEGIRIDRYCDELHLTVEERLELFCQVCSAVQYAHRNLVVHRDLKPANILVTAERRVKLLDFGIAKLIGGDAAAPDLTITSERLLTPLYASPEQIRGDPISTASDVYTLGVLLNCLLTGRFPYRLTSWEHHEVARAVLDEEALRPSLSVLRSDGAPKSDITSEQAAIARSSTQQRLRRRLQGDLDAIVLKAIDKEPGRRYATAEQLETDVRRHLTGQPVVARPESWLYHSRKFVKRHRAGVVIAASVATLVLAFGVVATVQRERIRAQAERIAQERDRAEQVGRFFLNTFKAVAPGGRGLAARDILDSATARIDAQLTSHPADRARLIFEMARAYNRLELNDRARVLLETSLAIRRKLSGAALDVADTQNLLGAVFLAQGKAGLAENAHREALALRKRELGSAHRDVARALVGLSLALREQRRFPEAERVAREAIQIDRSRRGEVRADLAESTRALAHVLADNGEHRVAAGLFRQVLTLMRATHAEEDPEVANAVFDLASTLHFGGSRTEADSLIRYGVGLQRRLLTAALLRGTVSLETPADASMASESRAYRDVTDPVERAFAGDSSGTTAASAFATTKGSQIAFVTDRHGPDPIGDQGNQDIYVMNADGSDQRRLTLEKSMDFNPAWSPDGRKISFTSQRSGGFDIFVMNADGTDQRQVTSFTSRGLGAVGATWSPDGKRIAFVTRVNQSAIYVINIDGTGLTRISRDSGGALAPAWSPDGRKIAFSSRRHGPFEIFVMDADGRNVVRLTANTAIDQRPAWSPDGRRIAFHSDRDGDMEIYVMNADGSNQVRLTRYPGEDAHASWSPDGRHIVFHRRVLNHGQVFVMNADGTGVKRLTELSAVAFNAFPAWGPARR